MSSVNKGVVRMDQSIAPTCGFKRAERRKREIFSAIFAEVQIAGFIRKNEQRFSFVVAHSFTKDI
jgi:hypothetical protein